MLGSLRQRLCVGTHVTAAINAGRTKTAAAATAATALTVAQPCRQKHRLSATIAAMVDSKLTHPMAKKIKKPFVFLVAVDGSPHSFRALNAARHMHNIETNDQLIIVHVVDKGPGAIVSSAYTPSTTPIPNKSTTQIEGEYNNIIAVQPPQAQHHKHDSLKAAADREVLQLQTECMLRIAADVPADSSKFIVAQCEAGIDMRDKLVSLVTDYNVDFVFVGRRGNSVASRLSVGSVSQYLMDHAPCNIVLIK